MEEFQKLSFLLILVLIILAIIVAVFGIRFKRKMKQELERSEEEFTNLLLKAFLNDTISGVADILSFYHAHFSTDRSNVLVYRNIYSLLEKAQLRISSGDFAPPQSNLKERLPELRELMKAIASKLETEEKKIPFFGTPASERELLEDILELTDADKEIVNGKLSRLAELIRARQETVTILGEEKGKARRLSFWGLAGTIFFGLLSIVLSIWKIW